jgi:hypothetical protein
VGARVWPWRMVAAATRMGAKTRGDMADLVMWKRIAQNGNSAGGQGSESAGLF